MSDQTGDIRTVWKVAYLFTINILTPLVLWAMTGGFFLNELLRAGMSYGLYRILGFGGGQIIYILLFSAFWYGIGLNSLVSNKKKSPTNRSDAGCAVFLVCTTLLAVIILLALGVPALADRLFPPRLALGTDMMKAAEQACKGFPVPAAAGYPGSTGLHPLVLANPSGGWHSLTNKMPKAWKPNSVKDLQLVACASEVKKLEYEVCNYSSAGEFKRYQEMINIRIVAAKTGALVEEQEVLGAIPSKCPSTISSSGTHSSVGSVNVSAALVKFVKP
jgi:hypothetical protein